ncbi:MAG: DUF4199 family protein [Bacteroidota bacterium]
MSEPATSLIRVVLSVGLKYGLVGSVIAIGLFFAMQGLGENPMIWSAPKLIAYSVIFMAFSLLALVEFRRYHWVGKWKFWYGLLLGIAVYGTICLSTFLVATLVMQLDDSLVSSYREVSLQSLESRQEEFLEQFGADRYNETQKAVVSITATGIALDDLLKKLLLGFFLTSTLAIAFSVISSLRARRLSNS